MEVRLREEDKSEILRYLEYHGQQMEDHLGEQIDRCMEMISDAAQPRYVVKEVEFPELGIFPPEYAYLTGEDIHRHLAGCKGAVFMAATLGAEVENTIRRAQIKNVSDAVIMDSCASTLIEILCDNVDAMMREKHKGEYLTTRYSPGYGDLPITVQKQFLTMLNTSRTIGLTVSESGIMIPRKSVSAIIGISDHLPAKGLSGCGHCNMKKACRFLRRGVRCGK